MANAHTSSLPFQGFSGPNYTQVPDALFDELLAELSGAELKVLLYIIRRTFGFKKSSDAISFTQICGGISTQDGRVLDRGTGLSKSTAQVALKGLLEKHIIVATKHASAERGLEPTSYALNLRTPYTENRHSPMPKTAIALCRKSVQQETEEQEDSITILDSSTVCTTSDNRKPLQPDPGPPIQKPVQRSTTNGFETVGVALKRHTPLPVPSSPEDCDVIRSYLKDVADELGDRASLAASTARALNLLQRAGCSRDAFIGRLFEARAITKQSATTRAFPYFFAVLEDLLGLKAHHPNLSPPG